MIRTQIQLTPEQADGLKQLAQKRGCSMAEVIRGAVQVLLSAQTSEDSAENRRRALEVAGMFRSGLGDLSQRHDDYLVESDW